jgi:hypothetical protein
MEFNLDLTELLKNRILKRYKVDKNDQQDVVIAKLLPKHIKNDESDDIAELLDQVGKVSQLSKSLKHPITTAEKFKNSDQVIYLKIKGNT